MKKLTLQQLKDMEPSTRFASGEFLYDGLFKKWLAVRGGIWDWAIYYGEPYKDLDWITSWGTKLHDMSKVKELVDCNEKALGMYRH